MDCERKGQKVSQRADNVRDYSRRISITTSKVGIDTRKQNGNVCTDRQNRASQLRITQCRAQNRSYKMVANVSPQGRDEVNATYFAGHAEDGKQSTKDQCAYAQIRKPLITRTPQVVARTLIHHSGKTMQSAELSSSSTMGKRIHAVPFFETVQESGAAQATQVNQDEAVKCFRVNARIKIEPQTNARVEMNEREKMCSPVCKNDVSRSERREPNESDKKCHVRGIGCQVSSGSDIDSPEGVCAQKTSCTTSASMRREIGTETMLPKLVRPIKDGFSQTTFYYETIPPPHSYGEKPVLREDPLPQSVDKINRMYIFMQKAFTCIKRKHFIELNTKRMATRRTALHLSNKGILNESRSTAQHLLTDYACPTSSDPIESVRVRISKHKHPVYVKRQSRFVYNNLVHLKKQRVQEVKSVQKGSKLFKQSLTTLAYQLQCISVTLNEQHMAIRSLVKQMEELTASFFTSVRSQQHYISAQKSIESALCCKTVEQACAQGMTCQSIESQDLTTRQRHISGSAEIALNLTEKAESVNIKCTNRKCAHCNSPNGTENHYGEMDEDTFIQGPTSASESIPVRCAAINCLQETPSLQAEQRDNSTSNGHGMKHEKDAPTTQSFPALPNSQRSDQVEGIFDINSTDLISSTPSSSCSSEPTSPTMTEGPSSESNFGSRRLQQYYRIDYMKSDGMKCVDRCSYSNDAHARSSKELAVSANQLMDAVVARECKSIPQLGNLNDPKERTTCSQSAANCTYTRRTVDHCNKPSGISYHHSMKASQSDKTVKRFTPNSEQSSEMRVNCFGDVSKDPFPRKIAPTTHSVKSIGDTLPPRPPVTSEIGMKRVWENMSVSNDAEHSSRSQTASTKSCNSNVTRSRPERERNSSIRPRKYPNNCHQNPMFFKGVMSKCVTKCTCAPIPMDRCSPERFVMAGCNNNSAHLDVSEVRNQKEYGITASQNGNIDQSVDSKVHFIKGSTLTDAAECSSKSAEYALPEPEKAAKDSFVAQRLRNKAEQRRQLEQQRLMEELQQLQQRKVTRKLNDSKKDEPLLSLDQQGRKPGVESPTDSPLELPNQDGGALFPSNKTQYMARTWPVSQTEKQVNREHGASAHLDSHVSTGTGKQRAAEVNVENEETNELEDVFLSSNERHKTSSFDLTHCTGTGTYTEATKKTPANATYAQHLIPVNSHEPSVMNQELISRVNQETQCDAYPFTDLCAPSHSHQTLLSCADSMHCTSASCGAHIPIPARNHLNYYNCCGHQLVYTNCGCYRYPKYYVIQAGEERSGSENTSISESSAFSTSSTSGGSSRDNERLEDISDPERHAYTYHRCPWIGEIGCTHHHHCTTCNPTLWSHYPHSHECLVSQTDRCSATRITYLLSGPGHHCAQPYPTGMHAIRNPSKVAAPQRHANEENRANRKLKHMTQRRSSVRFKLPGSSSDNEEK